MTEARVDCIVVGSGPVGLAAAAALATRGLDIVLAGPRPAGLETSAAAAATTDPRTAALFPASIALLKRLGAWTGLQDASATLAAIRIVDATGSVLRAPELLFEAAEIGWPGFGFNVPQAGLSRALWECINRRDGGGRPIRVIPGGQVTALVNTGGERPGITAVLADGQRVHASVVIAADGRSSVCRAQAGIDARRWTYPQTALVTSFAHGRPHRGISTELHTAFGPCTTVPMPGRASSLVWVERPAEAERLAALDDGRFVEALETRLGGLLGTVSQPRPRRCFALSGLAAETLGRNRVALVGEAAHVIPPIGAQGLNLGLFDVAVLADVLANARARDADLGGPEVLAAYHQARKGDIERRMQAVDIVNRMLISGLLPLSLARGIGLHMIAASSALRRRVMLEGLQPSAELPSMMSGAS